MCRNVLVTGATSGIGLEIVKKMSDLDYQIILTGRDIDKVNSCVNKIGKSNVMGCHLDITNEESIIEAFNYARKRIGKIDTLINNAGAWSAGSIVDLTKDDWLQMYDTNIFGPAISCKYFVKQFITEYDKQSKGYIVNIGSNAVYQNFENQIHYNSSKAALISLTKGLSKEVARYNINVNAVCPGSVNTKMFDKVMSEFGKKGNSIAEEDIYPPQLKRFVTVDEVAETVIFLTSSKADAIRGHVITVDGGSSL